MGIWTTHKGKSHKVNIVEDNIQMMQSHGARFCWFHDNPMIKDEKSEFYETQQDENDNPHQVLKEELTVVCEDGDIITGYIIHLVDGFECHGTDEGDWFIIKPESKQELIVEDL